jgi:hypothetical protein
MSGFERLGRQDRIALWPDEAGWQQDIGVVARLDGDRLLDGDDCVRLDVVLRWIETGCRACPACARWFTFPGSGWARRCGSMLPPLTSAITCTRLHRCGRVMKRSCGPP